MPIYAYRCQACHFAKDVLQKVSDASLVTCPSCGQATFKKQVTAAGFQLKGTGWYATDFRGNNNKAASTSASNSETNTQSDEAAKPAAPSTSTSTPSSPNASNTSAAT